MRIGGCDLAGPRRVLLRGDGRHNLPDQLVFKQLARHGGLVRHVRDGLAYPPLHEKLALLERALLRREPPHLLGQRVALPTGVLGPRRHLLFEGCLLRLQLLLVGGQLAPRGGHVLRSLPGGLARLLDLGLVAGPVLLHPVAHLVVFHHFVVEVPEVVVAQHIGGQLGRIGLLHGGALDLLGQGVPVLAHLEQREHPLSALRREGHLRLDVRTGGDVRFEGAHLAFREGVVACARHPAQSVAQLGVAHPVDGIRRAGQLAPQLLGLHGGAALLDLLGVHELGRHVPVFVGKLYGKREGPFVEPGDEHVKRAGRLERHLLAGARAFEGAEAASRALGRGLRHQDEVGLGRRLAGIEADGMVEGRREIDVFPGCQALASTRTTAGAWRAP